MTLPIPEFDPEGLTLSQCEDRLVYYLQRSRELERKLRSLQAGEHTIMCQTALDTLEAILHVYRERITVLANLVDQFKARKLTCQEINDYQPKKNSTNP
jgi:hypothetical protein